MSRPKILMLTHRIPYPPDRGDRIRSFNLLSEFVKHWDVWLACTNDEPIHQEQVEKLETMCAEVATATCMGTGRWLQGMKSAVSGRSLTEGLFYSRRLKRLVEQWHREQTFDAVFCFCSNMFPYVQSLEVDSLIVDLVDVDSQKWADHKTESRSWKRWVYAMECSRVRALEREAARQAKHLTLVSEQEVDCVRSFVEQHVSITAIPNGVDVEYFRPRSGNSSVPCLTFVGVLDYGPNVEGITWFAGNVLPIVQRTNPVQLNIVGRRPSTEVKQLATLEGVTVHPDVPDVRELLHRATIVVAPLRIARGVQNKVLEAMACGKPIVLTSAAAEGISAVDGEHFVVANTAEQFAKQIIVLLTDLKTRKRIGDAARRLVVEEYTWGACLASMVEIVSNAVSSPQAAAL